MVRTIIHGARMRVGGPNGVQHTGKWGSAYRSNFHLIVEVGGAKWTGAAGFTATL